MRWRRWFQHRENLKAACTTVWRWTFTDSLKLLSAIFSPSVRTLNCAKQTEMQHKMAQQWSLGPWGKPQGRLIGWEERCLAKTQLIKTTRGAKSKYEPWVSLSWLELSMAITQQTHKQQEKTHPSKPQHFPVTCVDKNGVEFNYKVEGKWFSSLPHCHRGVCCHLR